MVPCREGNAFPPACRLHCRKEFEFVRKQGRKRHTPHFLVVVMQKPCGPTRLGLTVSRKVGGAVARNLVKRLVREFFRLHYERLPQSVDLVVVAKQGAANLSYAQVCTELEFLTDGQLTPRTACSRNSPLS